MAQALAVPPLPERGGRCSRLAKPMTRTPREVLARAAFALATFDAFETLWAGDFWPGRAPPLISATALLMPFAFYGLLLFPAARWLGPRGSLRLAYGAFAARQLLFAGLSWSADLPATDGMLRWAAGVALALAVLWCPWPRFDRWFRRATWAAIPAGAASFALLLLSSSRAHHAPPPQVSAPAGAPNLVLISWDTIRADVLSLYGGKGLATPHLDAFARRSLVFEDACASTPITGPSHATMLTGLLPPTHGMRTNISDAIVAGAPLVAEELAENGYRTGGFVGAYPLLRHYGFARGFEVYDDRLGPRMTGRHAREAAWSLLLRVFLPVRQDSRIAGERVQQRALAWLEALPADRPFFLFLHQFDAHGAWSADEPHLPGVRALAAEAQPQAADARDAENLLRYRAAIQRLDGLFGDLVAALEARDPGLRRTLVLFTSDHGECFGEGGILHNHTASLYEATQWVPMLLHLPGGEGRGRRVPRTVTHLDVAPTLLAAAGIGAPEAWREVASWPLQRLAQNGGWPERKVYLEAQHRALPVKMTGWRTAEWKLVDREDGTRTLWRFREDEQTDRSGAEPELAAALLAELRAFLERLPRAAAGAGGTTSAEDRAAMAALGYAGD